MPRLSSSLSRQEAALSAPWQLQEAKNRFSQVVEDALHDGPQTVTRRGKPVVVVVSIDTWQRLEGGRPCLKDYLRTAPLEGLDLVRETAQRREADLP